MTKAKIVENIIAYLGDDCDDSQSSLIGLLVKKAWNAVKIARNYPDSYTEQMKNQDVQDLWPIVFDLALYNYNKQGIEGENAHSEGGTSQSFVTPESIMKGVVSIARII